MSCFHSATTDLAVVVALVDVGPLPEAKLGDALVSVLGGNVKEGHSELVLVVYWHRPIRLYVAMMGGRRTDK